MAENNIPAISDSAERIQLGIKTEVLYGYAQPDFDSIGGQAFAARLKGSPRADMLAIVCNKGQLGRAEAAQVFRPIDSPSLLRLHEFGTVLWPSDGNRYFSFTIDRPQEPRFLPDLEFMRPPMHDEVLLRNFVVPMNTLLHSISGLGHAHGAIRLSNIYWRDGATTLPQLGECLSAPNGVGQHAIYESYERMQTAPAARGPASHLDDMYAFGVCLALLTQGRNPLRGMDEAQVIAAKIEKGTYNSLISNIRVSPAMVELLRGLLADDPRERWKAADLEQWVGGRRLTPKPAEFGRKASRPLLFAGQEYYSPRVLASVLPKHVPAAAQLIDSGELMKWLQRTVNDEQKTENLELAITAVRGKAKGARSEDLLVSYACMVLDPSGPIRWRGLTLTQYGVGAALADAVRNNGPVQSIAEVIIHQLLPFWVELQNENKTEFVPLAQTLDRMKPLIEKNNYGAGVDRVIYELNPSLPCLSPILAGQNVTSGRELLPALERVAARGGKGREPIDRHIAAFMIARDKRSEASFTALQGDDQLTRAAAIIRVYADCQARHGPDKLPALSGWLLPILEPAANRYHNRPFRETVRRELRGAAERGSLVDMYRLLDEPRIVERDQMDYNAARKLYAATVYEIRVSEQQIKDPAGTAAVYGRPAASYVSCLIASGILIMAILKAFAG